MQNQIFPKTIKIKVEYHTQKLIAETRPDRQEISRIMEKLNKPPENTRDRLLQEQIDRRLNVIPDQNFQKAIEKLPPEHAKTLTTERERSRTEEKDLDRARSISRSR